MGEFVIKDDVPEVKPRKKHNGWKIFLAWFGGFIGGIGMLVGGVFIGLTVIKSSQVVSMLGLDPNEFLGPNFQNESLLTLIKHVTNTKFNSLEDVYYVTPYVKTLIEETINPVLEEKMHFTLEWEEMKDVPFTSEDESVEVFGQYLERVMMENIKIINFIENPEDLKNVYNYFFYDVVRDEEGNVIYDGDGNVTINFDSPFSLKDYMAGVALFDGVFDYMKVGDVMNVTDESSELVKTIAGWKISEIQSKFDTLTIGELFTDEEIAANNLLNAVQDWTISDFSDPTKIDNLTIADIVDVTDPDISPIITRIQDYTIAQLKSGDFIDLLHLSDIFGSDPTGVGFLDVLIEKDYTVADLSDDSKIMGITIEEIFPDLTSDDLLYNFRDYSLEEMSDIDTSNLLVVDVFSSAYIASNSFLTAVINNKPDCTIGQLLDYNQTISHITLAELLPASMFSSNSILDAMKTYEIGSLGTAVNNLTLADIITIEEGEENSIKAKIVDALGDYNVTEIGDHFEDLTLGDFIDIDSSSPQILKSLQDTTLGGLESKIASLTLGDALDIPEGSALDKPAIKTASINSVDLIGIISANLTLGDIIDIPSTAPKLLRTLKDVLIDDIYVTICGDAGNPGLTLGDVIDIDSSSPLILQSLAGASLFGSDDISSSITNLKFNQVYAYDSSWSNIMKSLWGDPSTGGDFLITQLDTRVAALKLTDVLGSDMYESDGVHITATWWLLLKPEGENTNVERIYSNLGAAKNYTVSDFGALVTNLNYHMQNDSLFSLIDAGFITIDSTKMVTLNTYVTYNDQSVQLGSLNISQFIDYCLTHIVLV